LALTSCIFNKVYCAAPQCLPNWASILTGRYLWQNDEAGTHASLFPAHLKIFTEPILFQDWVLVMEKDE